MAAFCQIERESGDIPEFPFKLNNQNLIILLSTRQTISKSYQRSSQTVDIQGNMHQNKI